MESYSLVFPVCGEDSTLAAMLLCPLRYPLRVGKTCSTSPPSRYPLCVWEKPKETGAPA